MQKVDLSTLNHDGVHGCATGWQQRSCWFDPPDGMENYVFGMWLVSKIASIFQTHVRLFYKNETIGPEFLHVSVYIRKTRSRDSRMELKTDYSLDHWCSILLLSTCTILCIYPMFPRAILLQWKWMQLNEHWTTRVHKALPAKGIYENLKACFPNISVQVEFNWNQTSVCWNISILHYRGTNHPKSRVQVHP